MRLKRPRVPRFVVPLVVLGVVGFLYVRPISSYLETRDQLAERRAEVASLRVERAPRHGAPRARDEPRRARAGRAADRIRPPGRAPLHRQGHRGLEASARRAALTRFAASSSVYVSTRGRSRRRRRPARPGAAGVPARRRPLPLGRPAVTEQAPYGADGEPFPTTYYLTCRHLVAAVSRLEAAGGVERWSAAVARGRPALRRRRSSGRPTEQVAIRRELAAGETGPTPARRSSSGSAARGTPSALKCLHAHVAFALARPGYASARRSSRRCPSGGPRRLLQRLRIALTTVASARREWAEGSARFLEAATEPGRRTLCTGSSTS